MDFIIIIKLMAVAALALLLSYFIINAVLSFISKFSSQLQKMTKNLLIVVGAFYVFGLMLAPGYTMEVSEPLIRLVGKIAPNFLTA